MRGPLRNAHVLVIMACLSILSTSALAAEARLVSIQGAVQVRDSATAEWKAAVDGAPVPAGAELRTPSDGTARLTFTSDQKSAIDVRSDSYVQIESVAPVRVNIRTGKIYSLIKHVTPGSSFVIITPTSIAAARGTGGEHGIDDLIVRDGTFVVETPSGETREVSEGFGVEFKDQGFGDQFEAPENAEWTGFAEEASRNLEKETRTTDTQDKPVGGDGGGPGGSGPNPPSGDATHGGGKVLDAPGERSDVSMRTGGVKISAYEPAGRIDDNLPVDAVADRADKLDTEVFERMDGNVNDVGTAGSFEGFEDIMHHSGSVVGLGDTRAMTEMSGAGARVDDAVIQTRETYQQIKAEDSLGERLKDSLSTTQP